MRTAVLYDGPSASGVTPDLLILQTVDDIEDELRALGHETVRIAVAPGAEWMTAIIRKRPGLVFNLCEGIDGIAEAEPAVIGVLELLGIPYTGASAWTTAICLRKHVLNGMLAGAGLPVPPWALVQRGGPVTEVGYPAICKPAAEDASVGVEQSSVVRDRGELERRLGEMHLKWNDILVQRYVGGRELNVGVVGDRVLPVSEIRFDAMPDGYWPIVSYRAKWDTGSAEDLGTVPHCPAELEPGVAEQLREIALKAWEAVGGCGFARVDFRLDETGPWLLEVNANPDISSDAGLARMAKADGMSFRDLIAAVCEEALARPYGPVSILSHRTLAMPQSVAGMASAGTVR
jgi:D-alanine-D-alanine ligase